MTHQSLILLATLLMMAGLAFGYWVGWAWDETRLYRLIIVTGCAAVTGIYQINRTTNDFISLWALRYRIELFQDTEPLV